MRPILRLILLALSRSPPAAALSGPGQDLAGVPDLRPVVQRYYEARATEENGRCRSRRCWTAC